jgi:hypothetical protein
MRTLGFVLLGILAACAPAGRTSPVRSEADDTPHPRLVALHPPPRSVPAAVVPSELDADERAVIAAVMNRELGDAPFRVIADSTHAWPAEAFWKESIRAVARIHEPELSEMLGDYSLRNRLVTAIPADLPTARPIRIYSSSRIHFRFVERADSGDPAAISRRHVLSLGLATRVRCRADVSDGLHGHGLRWPVRTRVDRGPEAWSGRVEGGGNRAAFDFMRI